MDCSEARLLIRRNMIAGAGPGRVPQLGFHLANCSQCRALYAARLARQTQATPHHRSLTRLLARPRPVTTAQRIARVAVVAVCCVGLMLTWFVGLPLARAVADVLVMTSLDRGDSDPGGVGHLASPPVPLVARTAEPSPAPSPTRGPVEPTVQTTALPTTTSPALARDRQPTRETLRDQADRWTTIDRMTPTAIAPIARVADETAISLSSDALIAGEPTPDAAAGSTTILFLGLDAREGEGFVARSDAILVAHLDPEHKRLAMLSLPRDLWVPIPGVGEGKINSAFIIGEQYGENEGATLAKETVGQLIGVEIDHVVVMDFTGFRSLVDALGGVSLDVPKELYDPHFPTEDYGYKVAHFLPGEQTMDGETALTYSRIRHPDSDFERMRRQEAVVLAIARKIRERGMVRNITEADKLTSALSPYMRTDMPPTMALNLLWAMRSVDLASAQYVAADGSMLYETNIGGAYAVYADPSVLHELGTELIEGTPDETTEPVSP